MVSNRNNKTQSFNVTIVLNGFLLSKHLFPFTAEEQHWAET